MKTTYLKKAPIRIIAFTTILAMLISLLPAGTREASAATKKSDETKILENSDVFEAGDGTESDPYQITTVEQLRAIENNLSAHYILKADLDLKNESNWSPIGLNEALTFIGSFDGNNHQISNLQINSQKTSLETQYYGLFGYCSGEAELNDIELVNVSINIDSERVDYTSYPSVNELYVGAIAGYVGGRGCIRNSSVSGRITILNCHDAIVGGVVGAGPQCENCTNSANIYVLSNKIGNTSYYNVSDGEVNCGGICGEYGKVKQCLNRGAIEAIAGQTAWCGGINGGDGDVIGSQNYGEISGKTCTGHIVSSRGNCDVGGIVGSTTGEVLYCMNYGNISSYALKGAPAYAGGLIGQSGHGGYCGIIANCTNMGKSITSMQQRREQNSYIDTAEGAGRITGLISGKAEENSSIDTTLVNGTIPTEDIGADKKNGTSISEEIPIITEGTSLSLEKERLSVGIGKNGSLTANIKLAKWDEVDPETDIIWTSSDENVLKLLQYECLQSPQDLRDYMATIQFKALKEGTSIISIKMGRWKASCIVTVGKTEEKPTGEYSADNRELTNEDKIQYTAKQLQDAADKYITNLQDAIKTEDRKAVINSDEVSALQKADKGNEDGQMLTMDGRISAKAEEAAYYGVSQFVAQYRNSDAGIGKIDISKDMVSIEASIINTIKNSLRDVNIRTNYQGYTVSVIGTFYAGAFSCEVTVSGKGKTYTGILNSTQTQSAAAMAAYLKALGEAGEDVTKQAFKAALKDFCEVTCITMTAQSTITDALQGIVKYMNQIGYGKDILKYVLKVRKGYELVQDLSDMGTADWANGGDKIKQVYKDLKGLSLSDDQVLNETVKYSVDRMEQYRNQLVDMLYNYIYHPDEALDTKRDSLEKIKDWFSAGYKKFTGQCPVEFKVYDKTGKQLGYAKDNYCKFDDSIYMEVSGDMKTIYIPDGMDVTIQMEGTDTGDMTYTAEQYKGGKPVGRMNYYKVPLEEGTSYTQSISAGSLTADTSMYPLTTDSGADIKANEYIRPQDNAAVNISADVEGKGSVQGTGNYAKGDPVTLFAVADKGYKLEGWYKDGILVELSSVYHLPAVQDTKVKAIFTKDSSQIQKKSLAKAAVSLSASSYTYNGSVKKPKARVKLGSILLKENKDYTVTYSKGRKNVGSYKVTVKGTGDYTGTITKSFKIVPKTTIVSKVTSVKKGFTVKWKKQSVQITGYQLQYSVSSKFRSGNKTATIRKNQMTSKKIKNLKAKKQYYIRVRTYKKIGKATYYSKWSKAKAVKTR